MSDLSYYAAVSGPMPIEHRGNDHENHPGHWRDCPDCKPRDPSGPGSHDAHLY